MVSLFLVLKIEVIRKNFIPRNIERDFYTVYLLFFVRGDSPCTREHPAGEMLMQRYVRRLLIAFETV